MRAPSRSVIICVLLVFGLGPTSGAAQTAGGNGTQTTRPPDNDAEGNPLLQGLIDTLIDELGRQQGGSGNTQDDVTPTRPTTPQPTDRTGPVIRPVQDEFVKDLGSVRVEAIITDQSRVVRAEVRGPEGRVRMASQGQRRFAANIALPSNYQPVALTLTAQDIHGNRAQPVRVKMRRVPTCGRAAGVSVALVRSVQTSLRSLSFYSGGIDGLAGPNTCGAIKTAGVSEPFSWPEIARRLKERADRDRVSDVPPFIPSFDPGRFDAPVADASPQVPGVGNGPRVPTRPVVPVAPVAGRLPGADQASVPVARINLPEWVVPVSVGFFGALAIFGAILAVSRRRPGGKDASPTRAAPVIRVVAVADASPEVRHRGAELPGLVLTVEPDPSPKLAVEFDTQEERVAQ